jgi:anti-sigma regulatory factor (Ser/Thr protein kinase)
VEALMTTAGGQLAVRASADDVRSASEWLEQICSEHDVPAEQILRLDLCLNEALGNIILHGGPSALKAPVHLLLEIKVDGRYAQAELSVSDTGQAFNPLTAVAKNQALTLADATAGGLGLTMINGYSDRLDYDFREGRNQLTFSVRWESSN